jgi:hypothetical protein
MKVVTIPTEQKFLSDLLMNVEEDGLILQTSSGQQFVLLSLDEWQGFDVGNSDDFAQEVRTTVENKALMVFLAQRKRNDEPVPMKDIKALLGLR